MYLVQGVQTIANHIYLKSQIETASGSGIHLSEPAQLHRLVTGKDALKAFLTYYQNQLVILFVASISLENFPLNVPDRTRTRFFTCSTGNVIFSNTQYYAVYTWTMGSCMPSRHLRRLDAPLVLSGCTLDRVSALEVNSLTTVGYLLGVFIKLWIPSMVHIFISAWS